MTESPPATRWFYAHGGRRHGPVEIARLVDLILAGEIPETTLIWHPGLPEWVMAREVDQVRRELPPPLPAAAPPQGLAASPPEESEDPGASPEGGGMRRRRKHRHRSSRNKHPWLLPLLLVLLVLMIGLWLLLRRMNEVPPGRIILQGFSPFLDGGSPPPGRESASRGNESA